MRNQLDAKAERSKRFDQLVRFVGIAVIVVWTAGRIGVATAIPLVTVEASPDVSTDAGFLATFDEQLLVDGLDGTYSSISIAALPSAVSADLVAYERTSAEELFAVDITVSLPGETEPVHLRQGDVASRSGGIFSLRFDASANGVPRGARVDGVSGVGNDLLVSFDVSVLLGGLVVKDEDIVRWDGASFTLFFDGSAEGFDGALDLDAFDYAEPANRLFISFDGSGVHGTTIFDSDDVLEIQPGSGITVLAHDAGSAFVAGPADVDGLRVDADSDADGLSDDAEEAAGTDPADMDSDDDGLLDGTETNTGVYNDPTDTGTDPLAADSDGDGVDDGTEVAAGTDPNLPPVPSVPGLGLLGSVLLGLGLIKTGIRFTRVGPRHERPDFESVGGSS